MDNDPNFEEGSGNLLLLSFYFKNLGRFRGYKWRARVAGRHLGHQGSGCFPTGMEAFQILMPTTGTLVHTSQTEPRLWDEDLYVGDLLRSCSQGGKKTSKKASEAEQRREKSPARLRTWIKATQIVTSTWFHRRVWSINQPHSRPDLRQESPAFIFMHLQVRS